MNKLYIIATITAVALALPTSAAAKDGRPSDKAGRFGLGYDKTLGNVGGLSARFQVAKGIGLQGIVNLSRISADLKDENGGRVAERSQDTTIAAFRGDVALVFTKQTTFSLIFGVNLYNDDFAQNALNEGIGTVTNNKEGALRFSYEAGFKAEHHFTDWLSVHGEVGILFALVNRTDDVAALYLDPDPNLDLITNPDFNPTGSTTTGGSADASDADGTVLRLGVGDPIGKMGFTFWLN